MRHLHSLWFLGILIFLIACGATTSPPTTVPTSPTIPRHASYLDCAHAVFTDEVENEIRDSVTDAAQYKSMSMAVWDDACGELKPQKPLAPTLVECTQSAMRMAKSRFGSNRDDYHKAIVIALSMCN